MASTAKNQMHGKAFENHIKAANGIFSYAAADRKRSTGERFDISGDDDLVLKIPTSIKSSQGEVIALSDARKFWESFDYVPYRILVGVYLQRENEKEFREIHEIIIREDYREYLLGTVTLDQVTNFHNGLLGFKRGRHAEARGWADERLEELRTDLGLVYLNRKIDSKTQRRLQCSVGLSDLIEVVNRRDYTLHNLEFGNLILPLRIKGGSRKFNKA
ncbi:MAG: hypothetical protein F4039_10490 [Gammaproteobacteria bacterium]|nr:hypothetical protein [Gammaproteobacteria bacterium]